MQTYFDEVELITKTVVDVDIEAGLKLFAHQSSRHGINFDIGKWLSFFADNPFGEPFCIVAKCGAHVVGFAGLLPMQMCIHGKTTIGQCLRFLTVEPEFRDIIPIDSEHALPVALIHSAKRYARTKNLGPVFSFETQSIDRCHLLAGASRIDFDLATYAIKLTTPSEENDTNEKPIPRQLRQWTTKVKKRVAPKERRASGRPFIEFDVRTDFSDYHCSTPPNYSFISPTLESMELFLNGGSSFNCKFTTEQNTKLLVFSPTEDFSGLHLHYLPATTFSSAEIRSVIHAVDNKSLKHPIREIICTLPSENQLLAKELQKAGFRRKKKETKSVFIHCEDLETADKLNFADWHYSSTYDYTL